MAEPIPENSKDKYVLYRRIDEARQAAADYNNKHINEVVNEMRDAAIFSIVRIVVYLNPAIECAIAKAMNRCQEIFRRGNKVEFCACAEKSVNNVGAE